MNAREKKSLTNRINKAYNGHLKATKALQEASLTVATAEYELKTKENLAISTGEITGKNAQERSANLFDFLESDHVVLNELKEVEQLRKNAYVLSGIALEHARMLVRIAELG